MDPVKNALNPVAVDWHSPENYFLLNPRMSAADIKVLVEVAQEICSRRNLQSHIWIATSGSTSDSMSQVKFVALAKSAFLASAQAVNTHLQTSTSDTWLQVLPRFHVGGLGIEVRAQLSKSKVVSDLDKWDPVRIQKLMQDHKVTITSMVPAQVFDLVQAKVKAPKYLRAVIVGGGALTETLYQQARKWGWPLLPSYGMTETCSQIATASLESLQSEQMPLAKKLDHAEWRLGPDSYLQVKGPSLLTCYGQKQKDGSILDWDPKENGWFTSEDHVDLQGDYVRVVGRKNDFIKIGGEGSSMGRLREIMERLSIRMDSAVASQILLVDAPSERLGTEIHLVTALQDKNEFVAQLRDNFNREVLPFERIREVKYNAQIARSELGKVRWGQLKKDLYGI
jgi:O-succinylbenzoic acid--CoA ligase